LARIEIYTEAEAQIFKEDIPNIDGIVVHFTKTPKSIVCPHFLELRWAIGCYFDCAYCYLQGTFRGYRGFKEKFVNRPVDKVLEAIEKTFNHEYFKRNPCIFNSGELSDSLAKPHLMRQIVDKFEEQGRHKLLLLTKSGNVNLLVDRPRKQTIFSFSTNAKEVWKRWEHKTPSPDERIEAAKVAAKLEDEVRVRIDPIFPIENWQAHYEDLIYSIFSEFIPERITLGTPRGLAKTLMFSKDLTWTKYFTEKPEYSGWGKKMPASQRREIYLFFYDKLCALGFDKSKIAICKETAPLWKDLGLDPTKIRCNCVW